MGGHKSKERTSVSSTGAATTPRTSSDATSPRRRVAQNFLLIWVDASVDESKEDCQRTLAQLRSVVNTVYIFARPDQCIQFLNGIKDEKAFVIISGSLGEHLVQDIHGMPQVDAIYIFCGNKSRHEQWTKAWMKIKGVHTDIKPICKALQLAAKQCNQDSIAVSFVTADDMASCQNLNQLESSFMYTQIFKEILLDMEYDQKSIRNLAVYCREFYPNNMDELNIIDEFERDYQSKLAVSWYTRQCFTYQMLCRALHTLEGDTIINMGFLIRDLHVEIEQLHRQHVSTYCGKPFIVYRGQGLLKTDFEELRHSKGGLMSFNDFLSTSMKREVSLDFAKNASTKTNMIGILFRMNIDPSLSSAPFASIREVSYFKTEEEILFSMHTVFRVGEIKKIDHNNLLYQVELQLTADDDQQLRTLIKHIRQQVVGETGWQRLGTLLIKLNQWHNAEDLYNVLLEQTSDQSEKSYCYHQLGYIKNDQGDYEEAIKYYEKALEIREKTLPTNYPDLATSCNNIAFVYESMKEYSKALAYFERSLDIRQHSLPPNHPHLKDVRTSIKRLKKKV